MIRQEVENKISYLVNLHKKNNLAGRYAEIPIQIFEALLRNNFCDKGQIFFDPAVRLLWPNGSYFDPEYFYNQLMVLLVDEIDADECIDEMSRDALVAEISMTKMGEILTQFETYQFATDCLSLFPKTAKKMCEKRDIFWKKQLSEIDKFTGEIE